MSKSTKVKSEKDIELVRTLSKSGKSSRVISKLTGFSRGTVKKIIRKKDGYESNIYQGKERVKRIRDNPDYISPIDGEQLWIQSPTPYPRVMVNKIRESLHIHECKKLYTKMNKEWKTQIVHHIDSNPVNYKLDNLIIFDSTGEHLSYHKSMETSMYDYLKENNLLDEFYKKNPSLKLDTAEDTRIKLF